MNDEYLSEEATIAILEIMNDSLIDKVARLESLLAAANNLIAELTAKLKMADDDWQTVIDQSHYAAELEPWADVGKRAVRDQLWLMQTFHGLKCGICGAINPTSETRPHDDWCPIPSLLAQLEADDE